MNRLTLDKCLEYEKLGWLNKHESDDGKLIGFKYSLQTVYDHAWDEIIYRLYMITLGTRSRYSAVESCSRSQLETS